MNKNFEEHLAIPRWHQKSNSNSHFLNLAATDWQWSPSLQCSRVWTPVLENIVFIRVLLMFAGVYQVAKQWTCSDEGSRLPPMWPGLESRGRRTDRLNLLKYSFSRFGARIWNSVPQSMRVFPEHKFKASLDQLLLHILELEDTYMLTHLL